MPDYPTVEESRERLRKAGWSATGEGRSRPGGRAGHWVAVRRGDSSLVGEGDCREGAWRAAAEAAAGETPGRA